VRYHFMASEATSHALYWRASGFYTSHVNREHNRREKTTMAKRVTGSVAPTVGFCLPGASAWGQALVNIRACGACRWRAE